MRINGNRIASGGVLLGMLGALTLGALALAQPSVESTLDDFYGPGTQPGGVVDPMAPAWGNCSACHGLYNDDHEPYRNWAASMMGQGARDPIFWAALRIAEQAAPHVADLCIRCHAPLGWIAGRTRGGGGLQPADLEGISCSVCHRMVDPVYTPGHSPAIDEKVLAGLDDVPQATHAAHYVIDPHDRRRGPLDLGPDFFWHQWAESPFHLEPRLCATCHDVGNPLFSRQPDGSYALNTLGEPHPTHRPYDQFPLERTYSEWLHSDFGRGPVAMDGRFGGDGVTEVSTCQDCHMPTTMGTAANPDLGAPVRLDLPRHDFRGATTWMLRAIRNLYADEDTGLTQESVDAAIARNEEMLRRASDLRPTVTVDGALLVRVINFSGHKLPTGHLEGRRMWLNVRYFDAGGVQIAEHGAYDWDEARLDHASTKVYEAIVGLDESMAAYLGVPPGPSHLFPLNNKFFLDNRIPPRGFTNEAYQVAQCAPVGYAYADGQYWDDTRFPIPPGAVRADVRLFYQTITREAVEGLRDANHTDDAGEILYQQWLANGKSPPVEMDMVSLDLRTACRADVDGDGALTIRDFNAFRELHQRGDPWADFNDDGRLNVPDFLAFRIAFLAGCF